MQANLSFRALLLTAALAPLVAGCALETQDAPAEDDAAESGYSTASLSPLARAGLLAVARGASFDTLTRRANDGGVGLRKNAATALVAYAKGPDGVLGTSDDGALATVAELDAVPGIGPASIEHLRVFSLSTQVAASFPIPAGKEMTFERLLGYSGSTSAAGTCRGGGQQRGVQNPPLSLDCPLYDVSWSGTGNLAFTVEVDDPTTALEYLDGYGMHLVGKVELVFSSLSMSGNGPGTGIAPSSIVAPLRVSLGSSFPYGQSMGTLAFNIPYYSSKQSDGSLRVEVRDGRFAFSMSFHEEAGGGSGHCGGNSVSYTCDDLTSWH